MANPVTSIRNVGPAMAEAFERAGLTTADAVHTLGADAAYSRLVETGTRPHFIGYYALAMGLQGRPWNDCQGKEKDQLRTRFDAIVAASKPAFNSTLERELDEVGVILGNPD